MESNIYIGSKKQPYGVIEDIYQRMPKTSGVIQHIRHKPSKLTETFLDRECTFLVKGTSNYVVAIKRVTKMLDRVKKKYPRVSYIKVKAMGRAIPTAMCVALHFKPDRKVDILTGTVSVVDELRKSVANVVVQERKQSSVEVHVYV